MSDIIELLKSTNENDRKKAVLFLAKKPSKDNLLIIRDVAECDESVEVRFFARKALYCIKEALKPRVTETARNVNLKSIAKYFASDKSVEEKLAVVQHAINKNMTVITEAFIEQLQQEACPEVVSALLIAIGKLGDESKIKYIIPYLNDENSRVRANAIEALEYTGSTKIYPYVISKIEDSDNRVRSNAAKALKKLDSVTALRILKAMLSSNNPAMQASAAYVMRFILDEANVELLAPLLNSIDDAVKENAIIALTKYKETGMKKAADLLKNTGMIQAPPVGPLKGSIVAKTLEEKLAEALAGVDSKARIDAVNESMQQGGLGAGKILVEHLRQERDNKVIATILICLGRLQYKDAIDEIVKRLKTRDDRCRANAVEAIRLIGDRDALKNVVNSLKDKNNRVKANAIIALNGEDYVDLFTPLSEMAESGEELMQKSAIYAIMEIGRREFYGFLMILEKSSFKEVAARAKECIKKLTDAGVRLEKVKYSSGVKNAEGAAGDDSGKPQAGQPSASAKGTTGFIDKTGELKIDFIFDAAGDFNSDLAPVKFGGKWGYCDSKGKIVITNMFDDARNFCGGFAAVKVSDKWGFVDRHGMMTVSSEYAEAGPFSEGLAPVRKGNLWGYVDKKGALAIKPQFDLAESFCGGFALVKTKGWFGKKYKAFIDKNGNVVMTLKFDNVFGFSDGLARVLKGSLWGYIDKTGRAVIKPQFDAASDFFEGFAAVEIKQKKGFIDKNAKMAIEAKYDEAGRFSDALAPVCQSSKWGYADREGKLFIKPKYDEAREFVNNIAPVKLKNKWGVINKMEKFILEPCYEDIGVFCDGFARVKKCPK